MFIIGPDKKLKLSILYPATTGRNFEWVRRNLLSNNINRVDCSCLTCLGWKLWQVIFFCSVFVMTNGWFREYPYPIMDGMNILTPPCLWKFQNTLPPCAPNSKSINPSSTLEFWIFSDPLEFLFDCLKVLTNRKLALFPPFKKMRQLKFVINVYSTL